MNAPFSYYVTPYYRDPVGSEQDQAVLEVPAAKAYDLAHAGQPQDAGVILNYWATLCYGVANQEARLHMCVWGHLFLETALRLDQNAYPSFLFKDWVRDVYYPCPQSIYHEANNQGAWGLLAAILADQVMGLPLDPHAARFHQYLDRAVGKNGKLVFEVKRTTSGIWYSYFALAPLLRAALILAPDHGPGLAWELVEPLNWLWQYVRDPDSWPWRGAPPPLRWLQRLIWPCADQLLRPQKHNWPANLYNVAGAFFNRPDWQAWGNAPPYNTSIFRRGPEQTFAP